MAKTPAQLIQDGERYLKEQADLIAKASEASLEDDLEEDAASMQEAQAEDDSDAAAQAQVEAQDAEADIEGEEGEEADEDDEDEGEEGEEAEPIVAKGDSYVDAGPLLELLDQKLASIDAKQDRLERTAELLVAKADGMLGAFAAQTKGVELLAKAQEAALSTPLRAQSKKLHVPTAQTTQEVQLTAAELFSKAEGAMESPRRVAALEPYLNRGDRQGLLKAMTQRELEAAGVTREGK